MDRTHSVRPQQRVSPWAGRLLDPARQRVHEVGPVEPTGKVQAT